MPDKKTPLQGEPVRGNGKTIIAQQGYNGNIPPMAIEALESELLGIMHGSATLAIHIKDGNFIRFVTSREQSFIPGKPTTGSVEQDGCKGS